MPHSHVHMESICEQENKMTKKVVQHVDMLCTSNAKFVCVCFKSNNKMNFQMNRFFLFEKRKSHASTTYCYRSFFLLRFMNVLKKMFYLLC